MFIETYYSEDKTKAWLNSDYIIDVIDNNDGTVTAYVADEERGGYVFSKEKWMAFLAINAGIDPVFIDEFDEESSPCNTTQSNFSDLFKVCNTESDKRHEKNKR